MDRTVREHVTRLKSQIHLLNHRIAEEGEHTDEERKILKAQLGVASLALAHYEAALKQERKLWGTVVSNLNYATRQAA